MTPEEQKKAALEAEQKAKAEADAKAEDEESTDDESSEEESEDDEDSEDEDKSKDKKIIEIDYKAELEKEREAKEKAEKALAEKRFKDANKRRKSDDTEDEGEDSDDEDDEDRPLTAREFQAMMARERQQTQKELQGVRIAELARTKAKSDAEAALIIEIHKNRTFPSYLSLEEQLDEAYVIANRKRIVGERDEALRALKGKDGVNRNSAQTHKDVLPTPEPKTSAQDVAAIKASGFKWNGVNRRYEKKLANGDTLFRDPKTAQTVRIPKR